MKNVILVTLLASTLGLGAAVQANDTTATTETQMQKEYKGGKHKDGKHKGKRGSKRGGKSMKRIAEKLELTEDQQAQLKTLREAQTETRQALREEYKTLRTEMKALDTTSTDYASQVAVLADKKADLERKKFIQRSESRQQFLSVLTEEQRTKLAEMKENRKSRGKGKRHGKRGDKQNAE